MLRWAPLVSVVLLVLVVVLVAGAAIVLAVTHSTIEIQTDSATVAALIGFAGVILSTAGQALGLIDVGRRLHRAPVTDDELRAVIRTALRGDEEATEG